ncbi:hypothetical protein BIW11_11847 [Tropilaelaps mercedesae]|uniref:Uncharacterized protein n=1 Tax=Tropilaelaps mercedesae TaxID=418985 RepID=A0A1V9X9P3_9ACAR|nr:hypothetical protein BIW11_11847 [Tropilaelaps mercedesae]
MLSNLASYLMGGAPMVPLSAGPSPPVSTMAPTDIAQGRVIAHQELRCIEEEDWLLVVPDTTQNVPGNSNRSSSEMAAAASNSPPGRENEVPSGSQRGTAPISIRRRSGTRCWLSEQKKDGGRDGSSSRSSSGSRVKSCQMNKSIMECGEGQCSKSEEDSENCAPSSGLEESWYVAPSACIARRRPVKLATSPLENLLIEHPSMSVYHHSLTEDARLSLSTSTSPVIEEADEDNEPSADEEMMEMVEQLRHETSKANYRTTTSHSRNKEKQLKYQHSGSSRRQQDFTGPNTAVPTVPHLKSQKLSLEAAMLGGRVSQKKDRSNRTQLDRLNKCRASSSQQRLRRSDRQNSTKNSFVNNNRKSSCQRMC